MRLQNGMLVQDFQNWYTLEDCARWYKSVPDFPNMYMTVQDGTVRRRDGTSRYRNIIYSTYKHHILVCTGKY